jgi:hypothetical protein
MALCLRINQEVATACRNAAPGVSQIYIANYSDVVGVTLNTEETLISDISGKTAEGEGSGFFYTYAQNKESSGVVDELEINVANGSAIYKPQVSFKISNMDETTRTVFKQFSQATVIAIVKTIDGLYYLVGRLNGLDLTTGSFSSGVASGDYKGFEGTISGLESQPLIQIDPAFDISTILVVAAV